MFSQPAIVFRFFEMLKLAKQLNFTLNCTSSNYFELVDQNESNVIFTDLESLSSYLKGYEKALLETQSD